jgi:hypothetical protein
MITYGSFPLYLDQVDMGLTPMNFTIFFAASQASFVRAVTVNFLANVKFGFYLVLSGFPPLECMNVNPSRP